MEVLVYEDTREAEANSAVNDEPRAIILNKRRRVSFAETQTVHVIPRHDDIETPPLLNADPLPSKGNSASELAIPGASAGQQLATPEVRTAGHDLPSGEKFIEFSHFTEDMDTGHESWDDEDVAPRRDSFDGLEDDSGCFVHLGHISHVEDDDSIVNEVLDGDMTMDATTFSRNLSQYLKSGTTFNLPKADFSGQAMKVLNDSDTRSEDDSMILTRTGAPHWALSNPQDVSMHADDEQSDMSLAAESDRIRVKKKNNSLIDNKISSLNAAEQPSPAYTGKSTYFSNKDKENLAPCKLQDGYNSKSPKLMQSPHCDLDVSMSLSNTMDISLHQSLPRQSDVLMSIDGNCQTSPMSRRRSDTMVQDTSFSPGDLNTTLPVRNLKDVLLDHTDYTITRKNDKEDLSKSKFLDSQSLSSNGPDTVSCLKHGHVDSDVSDIDGLHTFSRNREIIVDSWQNEGTKKTYQELGVQLTDKGQTARSEEAFQEFGLVDNVDRCQTIDNRQNISTEKEGLKSTPASNLKRIELIHSISSSGKKKSEDAVTSSEGLKQLIADSQQDHSNARSESQKDAKQQHSGNDKKIIRVSSQSSLLQSKSVSLLSSSSINTPTLAMKKSDTQIQSLCQDYESKAELADLNKLSQGKQLLNNGAKSVVAELRSRNTRAEVPDGKVQAFLEVFKSHSQTVRIVEDSEYHQLPINTAPSEEIKIASNSKVPISVATVGCIIGGISSHGNLKEPYSLEDILHHMKGSSHIMDGQTGEDDIVRLPPIKLQTLHDYLQFSCSVQPQMDWLSGHIEELEVKLQNAMKSNRERKTCSLSAQLQKLPEESYNSFKTKFASKHSLAKKRWILWKIDAQRRILAWLRESKDNLTKEVEAAKMKGQQVLHLKDLYSQIAPGLELNEPSLGLSEAVPNIATENDRKGVPQSIQLENRCHHYQEVCNKLSDLKIVWNEILFKIQSIGAEHSQVLQTEKDKVLFENDLKASIRKLVLKNNLLQQQQVMHLSMENNGEKSVINFSLGAMYLQSVQFEGDGPMTQVLFAKSLHPEAIEKEYPCMEAPLLFQYFSDDLHGRPSITLQHFDNSIQRASYLLGSWMDVLKEIKFCRRNFGVVCKFQILSGKLLLGLTFLQCKSRVRVTLTFDMGSLRGGSYPFDLKPVDVQVQTYGSRASNKVMTRSDMLLRIDKIQRGFGRLARICNYVESALRISFSTQV